MVLVLDSILVDCVLVYMQISMLMARCLFVSFSDIAAFSERHEEFEKINTEVLSVSFDSVRKDVSFVIQGLYSILAWFINSPMSIPRQSEKNLKFNLFRLPCTQKLVENNLHMILSAANSIDLSGGAALNSTGQGQNR